jgi:hypothetical protein
VELQTVAPAARLHDEHVLYNRAAKYLRVPEYVMVIGTQNEACSYLYSETAYHVVYCLLPLFSPALLPAIGVDLR